MKNIKSRNLLNIMMFCITSSLFLTCGCSSLIRQKPESERKPAVKKAKSLTAEEIAAMTPEQLKQYHEQKQKEQAKLDLERRRKQLQLQQKNLDQQRGQSLVDSFMKDRPSREKRKRLGDVSRQLNYEETSIFPWREGRRSEKLLK